MIHYLDIRLWTREISQISHSYRNMLCLKECGDGMRSTMMVWETIIHHMLMHIRRSKTWHKICIIRTFTTTEQ